MTITSLLDKGFTGRGRAGARLHRLFDAAEEDCTTLIGAMDSLVALTKSVEHAQWVLIPFRRHDETGVLLNVKLRWVVRSIPGNAYRNWVDIVPMVLELPMGMRVWYEDANMRAVTLNGLLQIWRDEQELLRRLIRLDSVAGGVVA